MDNIFSAFTNRRRVLDALKNTHRSRVPAEPPCPSCGQSAAITALRLCSKCGHHYAISAALRLDKLLDDGGVALFEDIPSRDPLNFPAYGEKLAAAREKTGLGDAYCVREGAISGRRVIAAALEPEFMMGSMGTAVGEAVTRAIERAGALRLPLIIISASGGARMQEGMFSLMQMAKTSAALRAFSDSGGLFISILTNPTTGGVTASFASLGDVTLAEPGALIGFAGPRVIEQTIGAKLPAGFQSAQFQLAHGFVDAIVPRDQLRSALVRLLKLHPETAAAV
ncbi:MAG: acetyl-CoA carboxylase carboxyl transferase subunit beta [Oscillospiraceae bacterium]|jgi:acetyl-CoA carboxylase carboxyl transferase subunit beta|nr:acetyl-CoA carboxylase carboxyl transferase subunit beta [Oscillospiraceae bacterium]